MGLTGCEHAMVGNTMALGMTLCLFFGTLQLGKRPVGNPSASPAPTETTVPTAEATPPAPSL